MKTKAIAASLAMIFSTGAQAKLVAHEWGTFTSIVGSDGRAQSGMFGEDEALPDFVHSFESGLGTANFARTKQRPRFLSASNRPPNCPGTPKIPCEFLLGQNITQKMETPVVYFYADAPMRARFDVSFPEGVISQSYPAPTRTLPAARPGVELKSGSASYEFDILKGSSASPPVVDAGNIYGHARNVASDLIRSGSEVEKFIFYRGLGEFRAQLEATSKGSSLTLKNTGGEAIARAFVVYSDGRGAGDYIPYESIQPGQSIQLNAETVEHLTRTQYPQGLFIRELRKDMTAALAEAGLYDSEAKAMLDTWEHGYFKTPGLRVLYVLSRSEVESILPASVAPQPERFERAFVGRVEVLLQDQEEATLAKILSEGRHFDVASLGRLAYPTLLRIQQVASERGILSRDLQETIDLLIARID